jgi:DUF4097 and DUF4098 domain-containing protein YvlB
MTMSFRVAFTVAAAAAALLPSVAVAQFRSDAGAERIHVREHVRHEVVRHVIEHGGPAFAEQSTDDPCRDSGWDDDYYRACDVREYTLPAGPLTVDAGRNGGIRVEAWDRNEILIRAVVTANARREEDARQLSSAVQVEAGSGRVSSRGPSTSGREWWSVSYRINVPRQSDLELSASNGGISIAGVHGTIRFDTTNGGVNLRDLGGDVRGETRNGGLTVTLDGDRWDGAGLDVQTSNGGVNLAIPDGYNAELTTRTVNGGFRSEIPMTVQGELSPRRGIQTTLGSGGAPVSVRTTNGGLRINRR